MAHSIAQRSTSPILRIPDELVVEIVLIAIDNSPWPWEMEFGPEWSMSRVCRSLRQAVINASALWTSVFVNLTRDGSIEIFKLYIERSAPRKIRVTLSAPSDIQPQCLSALTPDCINRIWALYIDFGSRQALDTVLGAFRNVVAPSLVRLEIQSACEGSDDPVVDLSVLDAANLKSLQLERCICRRNIIPEGMRTSLTHLKLLNSTALYHTDRQLDESLFQDLRFLTHLDLEWAPWAGPGHCRPSRQSARLTGRLRVGVRVGRIRRNLGAHLMGQSSGDSCNS
ncbi:hypothetical protein FB45DRAFT_867408 [Roridomyces roridus]|uniref:F-box domain-containing protein n=1 Tax=Roridomyces roridus TaxID=1738132 RepID=A0AAD7BR81_9AGAR|nr:hypothetical protein FB45DRAFT_867408 [Roridomyces roridus]